MSKNSGKLTKWKLVREFSWGCEFFYRKGVLDAHKVGDESEIFKMLDIDNDYTMGNIIGELPQNIYSQKGYNLFSDSVIMCLNKIKAFNLTMFLRMPEDINLKRSMLSLFVYQYRKGLSHGLKVSFQDATYFYENPVKEGFSKGYMGRFHNCLLSKLNYKIMVYLDLIKTRSNKIYSLRVQGKEDKDSPTRSTLILSNFISDAIIAFKTGKNNLI